MRQLQTNIKGKDICVQRNLRKYKTEIDSWIPMVVLWENHQKKYKCVLFYKPRMKSLS